MTGTADGEREFFVSFTKADRVWVEWIAWALEEGGHSVWFQHWDFKGSFVHDMDRAHDRSRRTVGVLSPEALASENVQSEWNARRAEDPDNRHDRLVLVRVRACEPPGLLKPFVWLDLEGCDEAEAKRRLLERVRGLRRKPEEPPTFPGAARHEAVRERPVFPMPHNLPQPNRAFVGRKAELKALKRALAGTGRTAITQPHAITGLGGIGKTQLALYYAYAHLGDYDLIRWLRAEEPGALAADYTGLAPALGLDPEAPDQEALIDAIRAKLESTARWLLVFDNAQGPGSLRDYLPRGGRGHVLITSRERHWRGTAQPLELDLLPADDAVTLLVGPAPDPGLRAEAERLAGELDHLPLALAQARAYLDELAVDIPTYRQRLVGSRRRVLERLPEDTDYPHSVATVWQASIEAAEGRRPAARPLLELLAFLAPDVVPRALLGAEPEALPEGLRDPIDRDEALGALHRFSLLRADRYTLTVHRLVQAVTRDGLDEATTRVRAEVAVRLVNAALPRPPQEHTDWPMIGTLLPHALAAVEAAERLGAGLEAAATVLNETALYHHARAAWAEAEPLYRRAVGIGERTLGPEHPDLATRLNNLAGLYQATGRYAEAEPLFRRAVAIIGKTLPPDHPHQALVRENYAALLAALGRNDGATQT